MIPALGYLTVWCDATTNTTPGLHTGFSLNRQRRKRFFFTTRIPTVLTPSTFGSATGELFRGPNRRQLDAHHTHDERCQRCASLWVLKPILRSTSGSLTPAESRID